MTRISEREPEITDDIIFTITFPADTDESVEQFLGTQEFDVKREKRTGKLIVGEIVSGHTDAVVRAVNVLVDLQNAFIFANCHPMNFELTARSMVTAPRPTKKKAKKKIKVKKRT